MVIEQLTSLLGKTTVLSFTASKQAKIVPSDLSIRMLSRLLKMEISWYIIIQVNMTELVRSHIIIPII